MPAIIGLLLIVIAPLITGGVVVGVWTGTRLWQFIEVKQEPTFVPCVLIPPARPAAVEQPPVVRTSIVSERKALP